MLNFMCVQSNQSELPTSNTINGLLEIKLKSSIIPKSSSIIFFVKIVNYSHSIKMTDIKEYLQVIKIITK